MAESKIVNIQRLREGRVLKSRLYAKLVLAGVVGPRYQMISIAFCTVAPMEPSTPAGKKARTGVELIKELTDLKGLTDEGVLNTPGFRSLKDRTWRGD